jgi:hypothetical protein
MPYFKILSAPWRIGEQDRKNGGQQKQNAGGFFAFEEFGKERG